MRLLPAAVVVVFAAAPAFARPPTKVDEIPPTERPREHFYGAIADKKPLSVRWEATPTSVPFGQSITLTLLVANAVNPRELLRPPLAELPEFQDKFTAFEDVPAVVTADEVRFAYKLAPRNEGPLDIPELTYRYYHPRFAEGTREQTVYAEAVRVNVTKPAEAKAPSPLIAPAEYLVRRDGGAFTRGGGPSGWLWAGLFGGGVLVWVAWVFGWRVLFPDAARLAAVRRHRAVRIALDRLRRPHLTPADVAVTVRNYLIGRWGLAFTAQTPTEVTEGLLDVGVPAERADEAGELLRACDAARFAGTGDRPVSAGRVRQCLSPPSACTPTRCRRRPPVRPSSTPSAWRIRR